MPLPLLVNNKTITGDADGLPHFLADSEISSTSLRAKGARSGRIFIIGFLNLLIVDPLMMWIMTIIWSFFLK